MPQLERKHRTQSLLQFGLALVILIVVNLLAGAKIGGNPLYTAFDLTEDKRFTLTEGTIEQLESIEDRLTVNVLLTGELPGDYERLREKVEEMLIDFRGYSPEIEYFFSDPLSGPEEDVRARQRQLQETQGILPVTVYSASGASERSVNAVYPYAILTYRQRTRVVPFLATALPGMSEQRRVNQAESLLEYNFSRAIKGLTDNDKPLIGFTLGHGELPGINTIDLVRSLREDYELGPVYLDSFATLPADELELLVVAKPTEPFSDFDAFKLDQYVMNGGKVLWAIDRAAMDLDSMQNRNEYYPQARDLGLEDLFLKYGFKAPPILAMDVASTRIPMVTSQGNDGPVINLVPFPYHVLAIPDGDHPIVKNLDPVDLRFPTVLEPFGDDANIRRTTLLHTSDRSRRKRLPAPIDLDAQKYSLDMERFDEQNLPLAYLLEGRFPSAYANRLTRANEAILKENGMDFKAESVPTRMIVVADGDVMRNAQGRSEREPYLPLGLNRFEKFQYANKAFMLNAIEYLLDPDGVIGSRGKEVKLRLLDQEQALAEANYWRALNIGLPLLLLAVFGLVFNYFRRRRYAR